jgi:phospholipase C
MEDNWLHGQRLGGSFDATAGSIMGMFDFGHFNPANKLQLDPKTGELRS